MADTILGVVEQREGKLNRVSWETLTAGQAIAAQTGWPLEAAVVGAGNIAGEVAGKKVAKVYALESPRLEPYTPDAFAHALKQFLSGRQPRLVLMPHTYQVRDFAPKLAARFGKSLISDCIRAKADGGKIGFTRRIFLGKLDADVVSDGEAPVFATFQTGAYRPDQAAKGGSATVENVAVEIGEVRMKPEPAFQEAKQAVDLTKAEVIVAVGRGIKSKDNLVLAEKLAEALGGDLAASRPICDAEWLPIDRQIGSSGQTVAPKLYVALGISGAIQHLVGMKNSGTIVAINKDPEAPIFDIADYGIAGDLFEAVPVLTEEIKKLKGI